MYFSKLMVFSFLLGSMLSCTTTKTADKDESKNAGNAGKSVEVIKDCTGMYLRLEGKDWQVCNEDILKEYESGTKATATFAKIENCPEFDGDRVVCMMYHPKEGLIRVSKIK